MAFWTPGPGWGYGSRAKKGEMRGGMTDGVTKQQQSGVIPFRRRKGRIEVLLVTTRERQRWITPKGYIEPKLSADESAAKEAFEEAGLRGKVWRERLGTYSYVKLDAADRPLYPCDVVVYPMEVEKEADKWPESNQRKRRWLRLGKAAEKVENAELGSLIRALGARLKRKEKKK